MTLEEFFAVVGGNYKEMIDRMMGEAMLRRFIMKFPTDPSFANLEQALEHNPGVKLVLFCIDEWFLSSGRELIQADGAYPVYLYDDNPFNDVEYLLNREIFWGSTLKVLNHTSKGLPTTSFDEYSSWRCSQYIDTCMRIAYKVI